MDYHLYNQKIYKKNFMNIPKGILMWYFTLGNKRINLTYLLLLAFTIFGLYLRFYHIDFPAIGYHNMKENEYLDPAYNFLQHGNFLHKIAFAFYGLDEGLGYHEEYGQVPMVSYIIFGLWKIFGITLWMPRLAMILFMLGSVVTMYFVVKRLTNSEYLSLLSSFLLSFMPLGVYFGRNIQPESPALFFILLGVWFYLKWTENLEFKQAFLALLFIGIAGCFKSTFMIIGIPLLFIFPYSRVVLMLKNDKRKFINTTIYSILGILPFAVLTLLFELTLVDKTKKNMDLEPFRIFGFEYWSTRLPALKSYIADNYTWWFFYFAVFGLILALLKYKTRFSRFMIGYAFAFIPYAMMSSSKLAGHSYYQMPFLPLICILAAYFIYSCGILIKQLTGIKILQFVPLLILLLTISSVVAADNRVWDTIFYGQEVVGEYLQETDNSPKLMAFTHAQGMAVCSYARKGCGGTDNLSEFIHKEAVFGINSIYIDISQLNEVMSRTELFRYISENYKIDLVGLAKTGDQFVPLHLLLKRGGTFNMSEVQNKMPVLKKTYDTKHGNVDYYWVQND